MRHGSISQRRERSSIKALTGMNASSIDFGYGFGNDFVSVAPLAMGILAQSARLQIQDKILNVFEAIVVPGDSAAKAAGEAE